MHLSRFLAILIVAIIATSPLLSAENVLKSSPVFSGKEANNIIDVVKTYLAPRATEGKVKIWAFFTDKNVFNQTEFDQLAATVVLTDAARNRRAKMGREQITFADLPVFQGYIDDIKALGGHLRRVSRWLNAASFEIPLEDLDAVSRLEFVSKVRPVASYHTETTIPGTPEDNLLKNAHPEYVLNYGDSYGQLNQINVPLVHDLGFNGAGVIVAMFDTGFRKDHEAFAAAFAESRVLAEYDFIFDDYETQNEPEDNSTQHNHGTYTWSTLGGEFDGQLYGPAYGASFILAKTEDIRSETPVEEDNWAAAVEWADSIGASVISSSLTYSDWYTYADYDGQTCVITIAANLATSYGIVVSNSMGNSGPAQGTLGAPADAYEILSVGAVYSSGTIVSFSSRGPTADGRIKPEVCAQGVATYCASPAYPSAYTNVSGTSLSCPLIGGCAAVLMSARPSMTPQAVRLALMETASNASSPDNTYGWGIANLREALDWGARIGADVTTGTAPLTVSFIDSSYVPTTNWNWTFGDGDTSPDQNPVHMYANPGVYDVALSVTSDGWPLATAEARIIVLGDTLIYASDTVYAGQQAVVDINLTNTQELESLVIPFDFSTGMVMGLDSFSVAGLRTDGFSKLIVGGSSGEKKLAIMLYDGTPLPPGDGPVMRLFFSTDPYLFGNLQTEIDSVTVDDEGLRMTAVDFTYVPEVFGGLVVLHSVLRGDANNDGLVNVGDPVFLINYIFKSGEAPITIESGDANSDFTVDVGDAVYLINYIFRGGPPPNEI